MCVLAPVLAVPRHSWLGCWGVPVFVCALRLYPATPGLAVRRGCVCLGFGFSCAPPLLAGVSRCVCACVRAQLVPCCSWLGCAARMCMLGLKFRLRPPTPGWDAGVCLCSCARSACTPALLTGVCSVGECVWAWVSAACRLSRLGPWGVCAFPCALCLYPATPGWGVRCECVCLGSGFGCAPPVLARVLGSVCLCVRTPPVPCHSWLGCTAWVCVLGLGFWLRRTTPCSLRVCVCSFARSACTPPLLAGVCGVGLCVWAQVLAAPRHSWLGCWGVRICVCAPLVPRHSWSGCSAMCDGCCLAPVPVPWFLACCAPCPACGTRLPLLLGTCLCALVVVGGVPPWRASSPRVGAPRLVRSSCSQCSGRLSSCLSPSRGLAPPDTVRLRGARGGWPRTRLFVPAAGPCGSRGVGLAPRRTCPGPRDAVVLARPSGVCLALRALRWFACGDPVTDAFRPPYRPSFYVGLGGCTGAVLCGRRHHPFRVLLGRVWTPSYHRPFKLWFEFEVHLHQFFARQGCGQRSKHFPGISG